MSTGKDTAANVRIERMPSRRMAYMRVVGAYNHENLNPAFGRVIEWAIENGVMTEDTICLGVYYDDPEVTAPEKQRADVGITVDESFEPTGEVQVQTLEGGLCAVLRHQGHYSTLGDAYRWMYGVWLPESGREPAAAPAYEIYVNDANELPPEEWLTDICVPLAE